MLAFLIDLPLIIMIGLGIWFVLLVAVSDNPHPVVPSLILVLGLMALQFFTNLAPLTWAWNHVGQVIAGAGIYLVVGALYSIMKFYFVVKRAMKENGEAIRGMWNGFDDKHKQEWGDFAKFAVSRTGVSPAQMKGRISNWIAFWPFSLAFFILEHPVVATLEFIYERLTNIYAAVARSVWNRVAP